MRVFGTIPPTMVKYITFYINFFLVLLFGSIGLLSLTESVALDIL